ncbi:hypothetical protein Tco_0386632 [Tanacetum coccineum]
MSRFVPEGMSRSVPEGMSRPVPEGVSRSVPEGMSRSVPEGMSRSVPKGMSRSVLEGVSRSVPEGVSRSVPEEMSRSVPEGMTALAVLVGIKRLLDVLEVTSAKVRVTAAKQNLVMLVLSCFAIFDLEPLSLSFDFVFTFEIFKSLSFSLDRLCLLAILCLDQHAHTLHHLESLLTITLDNYFLDNLDILKEDLEYQSLRKSLSLNLELS